MVGEDRIGEPEQPVLMIDSGLGDESSQGRIDRDVFAALYRRFDGITWYVQRVLNRLWFAGEGLRSAAQVDAVAADLIEDGSLTFRDLMDSQNEVAKRRLPAIAKTGVVAEPNSWENG